MGGHDGGPWLHRAAHVFVEIFERRGVSIDDLQAREPMGMHKRDHLRAIVQMPAVATAWQRVHGRTPGEAEIDAMYAEFIPLQVEYVGRYADPIPGAVDVVARLRAHHIKIGSNTGYNREMMDALTPVAAAAGYAPDCMVCSTDVPAGRPAPWMALEAARRLSVYPMAAIVKVDDTAPGIEEGLNAGMWTIAVSESGNEIGLSWSDLQALDPQQRQLRVQVASHRLAASGAHYVIDSVRDLLPCLDHIEQRLTRGESP